MVIVKHTVFAGFQLVTYAAYQLKFIQISFFKTLVAMPLAETPSHFFLEELWTTAGLHSEITE